MPAPIVVTDRVVVPGDAVEVRAVRASGPGGQNVNKVASKVELRVDLSRIQGLDDGSRGRLLRLVAGRLDRAGRLILTSQRTRDQHRNLEDARRKLQDWIALALIPEKERVPTRPSAGSRERRLEEKRRRSRRKSERGPPSTESD
jgi:ribosome-associated protein